MTAQGQGGKSDATGIEVPVVIEGPWDHLTYRPQLDALLKDPSKAIGEIKNLLGKQNVRPSKQKFDYDNREVYAQHIVDELNGEDELEKLPEWLREVVRIDLEHMVHEMEASGEVRFAEKREQELEVLVGGIETGLALSNEDGNLALRSNLQEFLNSRRDHTVNGSGLDVVAIGLVDFDLGKLESGNGETISTNDGSVWRDAETYVRPGSLELYNLVALAPEGPSLPVGNVKIDARVFLRKGRLRFHIVKLHNYARLLEVSDLFIPYPRARLRITISIKEPEIGNIIGAADLELHYVVWGTLLAQVPKRILSFFRSASIPFGPCRAFNPARMKVAQLARTCALFVNRQDCGRVFSAT